METKIDEKLSKVLGGKYQITGRLGSGSFGEIYKGKDIISGDEVAIKIVLFKVA